MKCLKLLSMLLLLLALGSCFSKKRAICEVFPSEIKLNSISVGDTIYVPFSLKNIGKRVLKIYEINPSCFCIECPTSQMFTLKPKNELKVVLKIYRSYPGEFKENISIHSNDDKIPIRKLIITGKAARKTP